MRIAFRMQVNQDAIEEYTKRHNPIWKELEQALFEHGVRDYSIFVDRRTADLFGYADVESAERWNRIKDLDVCKRWWKHMSGIMPSNQDGSPVSFPLEEVFHIEA